MTFEELKEKLEEYGFPLDSNGEAIIGHIKVKFDCNWCQDFLDDLDVYHRTRFNEHLKNTPVMTGGYYDVKDIVNNPGVCFEIADFARRTLSAQVAFGQSKHKQAQKEPPLNKNKQHKCDCGAIKAKTTHSDWCSTRNT